MSLSIRVWVDVEVESIETAEVAAGGVHDLLASDPDDAVPTILVVVDYGWKVQE